MLAGPLLAGGGRHGRHRELLKLDRKAFAIGGGIIAAIKARPKPLALYLFTADEAAQQQVLSEVSFGGGAINEAILYLANGALPFGGVGDSGIGNYHGEAGFREFSHYKSILKKPASAAPDFRYSPQNYEKLAMALSMI
ncbi:aldehyde dehydrogenase family protein [Hymenobacter rigui]|uniref:aldehyde dehydrogenase family protein n=1 Tax=Hymenobacter rigui TaxID=334424 RepID=UPI00196A4E93|nr:aldehyde dehydrogenase family protein [Hymenobacter rigui]